MASFDIKDWPMLERRAITPQISGVVCLVTTFLHMQWKSKREGQLQLCSLLKISQSTDAGRTSKLDENLSMFAFDQGYFLIIGNANANAVHSL